MSSDKSAPAPKASGKSTLRVAVADDHRLMLDSVKRALEGADDIRVVGEAMSGSEMLRVISKVSPDVAIVDLRMPDGDGLSTLSTIRREHPDVKVIVLSASEDSEHIDEALNLGADGYVVKSINPVDLPSTVRQVVEGNVYHPRGRADPSSARASAEETVVAETGLTERELTILRLVAEGLSNMDIAGKLYVTEQTVKFHLSNIYRKLGVANRTEATRFAYRNNLIE